MPLIRGSLRYVAGCLLALGGTSCAGSSEHRDSVVESDSVGIHIVTVDPSIILPSWEVATIPDAEVGRRSDDPAHELFRVRSALRLSDGTLVVSNTGTNEIRLFDATGRHVRTLGRQGDGPGEFQWLASVMNAGKDSIFAFDRSAQRVTVFARDGAVLSTIPVPATRAASLARLADGSFVPTQFLSGMPRRSRGLQYDTATVEIYGAGRKDTLARVVVLQWFSHGPDRPPTPLPYGRTAYLAAGNGVSLATSDQLEIRRYSAEGSLQHIVRISREARPVDETAWERARVAWLSGARPASRAEYEARWNDLPLAQGLLAAPDGDTWLREFTDDSSADHWWVISSTGHPIARVQIPRDIVVLAVSRSYVIGRREDATSGEVVGVFAVHK